MTLKRRIQNADYMVQASPIKGLYDSSMYKISQSEASNDYAEINNRTKVDPTLDTNFRLSADSRDDNDVSSSYNNGFQRCTNTGNQHIINSGCQHF